MRRTLTLAALFMFATSAAAAWVPWVSRTYVRLELDQSITVQARRAWPSGIWFYPCCNWEFYSSNQSVARAKGTLTASPIDIKITGLRPGTAWLMVDDFPNIRYTKIEVVCGAEDPIVPAQASIRGTIGRPVFLEAVTPIAHRTTFTWYRGRMGDVSSPLTSAGPEVQFIPRSSSTYVWVLATTWCSTSSTEFHITAHASKERAVRR